MASYQFSSFAGTTIRKREDSGQKFKTEMCRNWPLGLCKFGDKCAFAHGSEDLRGKTKFTNYKTKDCKQFHELGYCQYGSRCQFKHKDPSLETASNSPEPERISNENEKRRLPVFRRFAPN
jgi:hypothetical protein